MSNNENKEKIHTYLYKNILHKGHEHDLIDEKIFYNHDSTLINRIEKYYGLISEMPKNDNYQIYHIIVVVPNIGETIIQGYKTISCDC